jgi:UDP-N-acetylmuramoyl-tripeptide--D-alanyl-D-alanine ligase
VFEPDELSDGCGFVAMTYDEPRSGRVEGHRSIERAVQVGAWAIVVEASCDVAVPEHVRVFRVGDSVSGYRRIAACWRRRIDCPVVAIGGAAGTTTTKDLLAAVLSPHYRVQATPGNHNGDLEVAQTILGLTGRHQAAVFEFGIEQRDAVQSHLEVVQPQLAVLTTLGSEYSVPIPLPGSHNLR